MKANSSGENMGMPGKLTVGPPHSVSPMTVGSRVSAKHNAHSSLSNSFTSSFLYQGGSIVKYSWVKQRGHAQLQHSGCTGNAVWMMPWAMKRYTEKEPG